MRLRGFVAKAGPDDDEVRRVESLLAGQEARIRREFLRLIDRLHGAAALDGVERLLERGAVDEALLLLRGAVEGFAIAAVVETITQAGQETALRIDSGRGGTGRLGVTINFDRTNARAVEIMRAEQLRLIREFTDAQRDAVRSALTDGIARGINPRDQARAFRGAIGLTARQERAVANYRRLLDEGSAEALTRRLRDARFDPTVARAVRGEPLTAAQIDRMVGRYRERYIKYRSEVIARTEALRAVHQGTELMYAQAIESGDLEPNELVREWITASDERVRSSHQTMHGQKQPVDQPFTSGNGYSLMYPGDPRAPGSETIQCRCVLATRMELEQAQTQDAA